MALSPEQRRRIAAFASEAREILFEDSANGADPLTFAQLEDTCIEAGDLFSLLALQGQVDEQTEDVPEACCPDCEKEGVRQPDDEARVLETDRGEVQWTESNFYCSRCRRAFFPSVR